MSTQTPSEAQKAAWAFYELRVRRVFNLQCEAWAGGHPVTTLMMDPPTKEQVAVIDAAIQRAVTEAKHAVIHLALGPLVNAIDACDNNRPKAEFTKALRARFQAAYDTLHEMKRNAEATVEPANAEGR